MHCEVRFYVQYYSTYKKARLAYESLLGNTNPTPKVVFGGPNGMIASNDINYFLTRYLTAWCPYHFGIWSIEFETYSSSVKYDNRWHIYLGHHTDTPDFYLPMNYNNSGDTTNVCNFLEPVEGEVYIPSEFFPNCQIYINTSPTNVNSAGVAEKTNLACINQYWNMPSAASSTIPFYYEHLGLCKLHDRVFLKMNDLNHIDRAISVKYYCSSSSEDVEDVDGSTAVNYTFSEFWGSNFNLYRNLDTTSTISCPFNNATGTPSSTCATNVVATCIVTEIIPSYLDFSLNSNNIYNNIEGEDNSANQSGTVVNTLNLQIKLNLYDPR